MTCVAHNTTSIPRKYVARTSDRWYRVAQVRPLDVVSGLSVSISAQGPYIGRLAAKVSYSMFDSQAVEFDVPRCTSIWLPGNQVNVYARLENPIDVGDLAEGEEGSLSVSAAIYHASMGAQRLLTRSFSYVDQADTVEVKSPIPPGAFAVQVNTNRSETTSQTVMNLGYMENATDFKQVVNLLEALDFELIGRTVTFPAGLDTFLAVGGPTPIPDQVISLTYSIQP